MNAVTIEGLNHSYGKETVLKDLSFSVGLPEFFIIIGPNGSGKTTLLKTINGLIKPQSGKIEIYDQPYRSYSQMDLARLIAFVPQEILSDFPFTVQETVLMGRYPRLGLLRLESDKDRRIAEEAMAFTDVDHLARRKLYELSGGERQRVVIARAICQEPKIMLLDEPTASLDLGHQIRIMDLMEKLEHEKNIAIIMVSHDINLASMYGDRLLLLDKGRAVELGKPEDVVTFEKLEQTYGCVLMVTPSPVGDFPLVSQVPKRILDRRKQKND